MFTAAMSTTKTTPPQSIWSAARTLRTMSASRGRSVVCVAGIDEHVLERPGPLDDARVLRVDPRLGARERDARRQPQQELVVLAVARALGQLLRREGERHEHPHLRAEEGERLGQHADDVVDLAVQAEAAPDDAVDACRLPCGEGIAQDRDLVLARRAVRLGEEPAAGGLGSEHLEERRRDVHGRDALRLGPLAHAVARPLIEGRPRKDVGHRPPVDVVRHGGAGALDAGAGEPIERGDQAV